MTKDQRRSLTKKALLDALVICLKDQDFNEITTIRLVQTAGISRSSFYTHYKDKYDMIERYQQNLFHQLGYIFENNQEDVQTAITEVFQFLQLEPLLAALLTENGTKEIQNFLRHKLQVMLADSLQDRFSRRVYNHFEKEYSRVFLANAFFGVCQMWIARGKKESPEQIAEFLLKML